MGRGARHVPAARKAGLLRPCREPKCHRIEGTVASQQTWQPVHPPSTSLVGFPCRRRVDCRRDRSVVVWMNPRRGLRWSGSALGLKPRRSPMPCGWQSYVIRGDGMLRAKPPLVPPQPQLHRSALVAVAAAAPSQSLSASLRQDTVDDNARVFGCQATFAPSTEGFALPTTPAPTPAERDHPLSLGQLLLSIPVSDLTS
ncbi:predicted protein [Coccidioides posadasii str. Silveira]|uniref:Predicted protein n=2 Tax=Coccidioides posadasii TaxID=199306 RepID=E9D380_COCPS|nr:predicted protein [Coccidioides posadasii str. Silveira]KMM71420.1 hypothetical protein CPAG_07727 [Coccidioides posadasii RMSCC 3488]